MGALVFCLGIVVGLILAFVLQLDWDQGGYQDGWTTQGMFPDQTVLR